ncbi:hypothetical protein NM688_g4821 [Phlebia brevispora]|uniref:Uncharacterized protein n=1 Tax=Phlebia brevispora TaxID=194682 RepID=A0ACC1T1V9_9APHY|nr:hypothetical protein NM688_g4821 [Phlebia brevispora]
MEVNDPTVLQAAIDERQQAIVRLQEELLLLRSQLNATRPMCRFPDEILAEIFLQYVKDRRAEYEDAAWDDYTQQPLPGGDSSEDSPSASHLSPQPSWHGAVTEDNDVELENSWHGFLHNAASLLDQDEGYNGDQEDLCDAGANEPESGPVLADADEDKLTDDLELGEAEVDRIIAELADAAGDEPATKADLQSVTVVILDRQDKLLALLNSAEQNRQPGKDHLPKVQGIRRRVQPRDIEMLLKQAKLRFFTMEAMGRDTMKDPIHVATLEEVTMFAKGTILPWNQHATELLADSFIASGYSTLEDRRVVRSMIKTHLHTLQKQYRKQLRGPDRTQAERETQTVENRDQRRRGIHTRRFNAHCADSGLNTPEFREIWNLLDYTAHSGDESEIRSDGETYFIRTVLHWRSEEFATFLRAHDYVHLSTRFHPNGKPKRGKFPRHRIMGSTRVEVFDTPVRGLPANCYNKDWLATLDQKSLESLRMLPAIDLRLSAEVQELVRRFSPVINGRTPPLPARPMTDRMVAHPSGSGTQSEVQPGTGSTSGGVTGGGRGFRGGRGTRAGNRGGRGTGGGRGTRGRASRGVTR